MREIIERVARAIESIPEIFGRRNKVRADGLQWEVGYLDLGEAISDNTVHIIAAFATPRECEERRKEEERRFKARAAISAIRDPAPEMTEAGQAMIYKTITDPLCAEAVWQAMVDEMLK
jgi:hypothetical protein